MDAFPPRVDDVTTITFRCGNWLPHIETVPELTLCQAMVSYYDALVAPTPLIRLYDNSAAP